MIQNAKIDVYFLYDLTIKKVSYNTISHKKNKGQLTILLAHSFIKYFQ